jgi:hypothetical protein
MRVILMELRTLVAGLVFVCCGLMAMILIPVVIPMIAVVVILAFLAMLACGAAARLKHLSRHREP